MNVLVVSPHPDDAELGMGGTIVRLLGQGHDVTVLDMTSGEPTPHGSEEIRARETAAANKALGNPRRINLGLPNRWLEATLENRVKLAEAIRRVRAEVLFVPYEYDAHPDHRATYHLAIDARFAAKLTRTDMAGEPCYPRKIIHYFCTHLKLDIQPTFVIDISEQMDAKLAAIACYQSQFYEGRGDKAGWIPEMVRTTNAHFGQRIERAYAEPFFAQEVLGLKGLDDVL
ncbi:MAG: N-acetyl-alpha-D-glucosaminyl L-malate deacetylase 1 [Phycisphaerae bacterium]|nr:N-acetyl-alpha-D-glucosaminyl L-malate deacetylase 1 [Phycisphaerae bacterium]